MMNALEAVRAWRAFAMTTDVEWRGRRRPWSQHIAGTGYVDEETLIQPTVFPRFVQRLLGFTVGENLAPERHGDEGKPDFTPADAVTHPWVFETKSTREGTRLAGHDTQVGRYLREGRPRIQRVVLTNLVGLRVMQLDDNDGLVEQYRVNLLGLLTGDENLVSGVPDAQRLADFLTEFRFVELAPDQKLERVRQAPPWSPVTAVTDSAYVSARLDQVVSGLERDVAASIGALSDPARVTPEEVDAIVDELRFLSWRLGERQEGTPPSLAQFLTASEGSVRGKALRQYRFHVAYYTATRLTLVRTWEDLGLLEPMLYDGGFNDVMGRFDGIVTDVVRFSFSRAKDRYRALFEQQNTYTWYEPTPDAYAEAIYELANTYFGDIRSDVLGEVYERLLERVDRKVLGQYYTPRDVIELIWELIGMDALAEAAEAEDRATRVLDIATGSGGFLVEAASRLRQRLEGQVAGGAGVQPQVWVNRVVDALNGVEVQRFPAYLAELNLLIQLGQALGTGEVLRVPPLGVLYADTLSLHNPEQLIQEEAAEAPRPIFEARGTEHRKQRIADPLAAGYLMDVACGNPPYIGEKSAAATLRRTRERHPYWNKFVGQHMDYLYWFLILGVSKLREGGRFGFITTEYWLRASGARPLRRYLAQRCRIDRLVLFRDMRLFPDAPGQHSLVVIGERVVPPDGLTREGDAPETRPTVSVHEGPNVRGPARAAVLAAIRDGRSAAQVRTFRAGRSPNALGGDSWSEVVMPTAKVRRREALRATAAPLDIDPEEGVLTGADRMRQGYDSHLTQQALQRVGWPARQAGIFVIPPDEVSALGQLAQKERTLLRLVVNTRDVYPYAAVPPQPGPVLLYLAAPPRDVTLTDRQIRELPFPDNMPAIEDHLTTFRGLLAQKVNSYNERRPWWSIHRPRPEIAVRDVGTAGWADYCVAARWGGGQQLIVGMAPARSAPVSGVNAMLAPRDVPGAYVCGLMNTTLVQELAETLPPGNVRAEDIRELGLPLLPDLVDAVSEATIQLAGVVDGMIRADALRFPGLPTALLDDIALAEVPDDSWLPEPGPSTRWGSLATVRWVESVSVRGSSSERISDVEVSQSLLGVQVQVEGVRGGTAVVKLSDEAPADAEGTVETYLWGHAISGGTLSEIADLPAPADPTEFDAAYAADAQSLRDHVEEYRVLRAEVDALVEDAL